MKIKTYSFLAAAAAAVIMLAACGNAINLVDALTDDVKLAKGLYLTVESVTPASGQNKVTPDARISIVFDREVDMESVTAESVVITPGTGESEATLNLSYSFNIVTSTLVIDHSIFFKANTDYTIRITTAVVGADGTLPREEYSWSFQSGEAPVGSLSVPYAVGSTSVHLTTSWNAMVDRYRIANTEVGLASAGPVDIPPPTSWTVDGAADGEKTIYIQYYDEATDTWSSVYSATTILDRTNPEVSVVSDKYINATGTTPNPTMEITASDTGSGIETYSWTHYSGTGPTTFSDPTSPTPVVYNTAAEDGSTITLRVAVSDHAGNTKLMYPTIIVDRTPPAPAVTVTGTSPSLSRTPTWSWSPNGDPTAINMFRYRLDSGAWVENTSATSYTPLALSDSATHTLYVQQRDTAGNWSTAGSKSIFVTPCIPTNGQTYVSTAGMIQWRANSKATEYLISIGTDPENLPQPVSLGTATHLDYTNLNTNTTYYWYIAMNMRGELIYSPVYHFTTVRLIIKL